MGGILVADENAARKQLLWEGSEAKDTVTAATFSLPGSSSYALNAQTDQSIANAVKLTLCTEYGASETNPITSVTAFGASIDAFYSPVA